MSPPRDFEAMAEPLPATDPYSRRVLDVGDGVEVMLAVGDRGAVCAHDHGGSRGLVLALAGSFDERRFTWERGAGDVVDLVAGASLIHPPGDAFAFGPEVVHDMASARRRPHAPRVLPAPST